MRVAGERRREVLDEVHLVHVAARDRVPGRPRSRLRYSAAVHVCSQSPIAREPRERSVAGVRLPRACTLRAEAPDKAPEAAESRPGGSTARARSRGRARRRALRCRTRRSRCPRSHVLDPRECARSPPGARAASGTRGLDAISASSRTRLPDRRSRRSRSRTTSRSAPASRAAPSVSSMDPTVDLDTRGSQGGERAARAIRSSASGMNACPE